MNEKQAKALKKAIREFTKKATKDPETARQVLIKEGIYTKSGRLSRNYSSDKRKVA